MEVKEHETENSRNSVEGLVVETVIVIETEEKECNSESNRDEQRPNENPSDSSVGASGEARSGEDGDVAAPNGKVVDKLGLSKVSVVEPKSKSCEDEEGVEERLSSCVIDVNRGTVVKSCGEKWDIESVCRICHLSSDQSPERRTTTAATSVSDLMQLGCGCKDDLGITHYQCAEAWFKLKGNRVCEICGETAKNVTGVGDIRFMEEWNERLSHSAIDSSERNRVCWRGQPFCNFLMACLVIAFVLPWFFRVNMF